MDVIRGPRREGEPVPQLETEREGFKVVRGDKDKSGRGPMNVRVRPGSQIPRVPQGTGDQAEELVESSDIRR